MAPLKPKGQMRPTWKLTMFEREAYTHKEIENIMRQEGREDHVQRPKGKKPELKRLWAKQDALLVQHGQHGQADYVSVPGIDGYDPKDNLTPGWKARFAILQKKHAAGEVDDDGNPIEEKPENDSPDVDMSDDADEEFVTEKRTIKEMRKDLEEWGRSYTGVYKYDPLRVIWLSEKRARKRKESEDGRDPENDEFKDDADTIIASGPEPTEATATSLKKRKRKEKDGGKPSRKRTKAGATKSVEVEAAVQGEEIVDHEDAHMIDADDAATITSKPQRKKTNPKKRLASQAKGSKRNEASESTSKGTPSLAPKALPPKQTGSMNSSVADESVDFETEHLDPGIVERDVFGIEEVGIQQPDSIATQRSARSKSAAAASTTAQSPARTTTPQKDEARLALIDEEKEEKEEEEAADGESDEEMLPAPSGRKSQRLASQATGSTRATRSKGAVAQDTTNAGPASGKHQNQEKKFWTPVHNTDNYSDHIPLSVTEKINPDSLEYPQLMSWRKNMRIMARRKAKREGKPWPPKSTKKPKYDYRKDPDWWKPDD